MTGATMTGANWLRLIGLSVPWGCSFLFLKLLAGELPPMTVALARLLVAAAALSLILAARGVRLAPLRAHWRSFLMLGLLNNAVPFTLISWGLTRVPSGTAAICNAMSPVFAVLVLRALGGPALAPHKLAGAVLGVAGVVVLVGPEVVAGGDLLGNLACLGAALSYGFGARHFAPIRALPTMPMVTAQLWAGILLLLPAVLLIDQPWTLAAPSAQAWAALLLLGLFSSAFGYMLFFRLAASAGIANAMLVTFLVPVTALLLGRLVLGEPITPGAVLGAAVIAAGLALLDGRWLPARRGTPA